MTNSSTTASRDVVVIGGGVIGLSIAWELARHGLSVQLLEQGLFGQEASWAGAGMLPPGNPRQANTTEARFRSGSHVLWPEWSEQLRSITGIDNGYHRCGGVEVQPAGSLESLDDRIATWRDEGVTVESLTSADLCQRLPALNPEISTGYFLPELGQVRNPRHVKALIQACLSAGVDLRPGSPVIDIQRRNDKVTAVKTLNEEHHASEFIVASGAWSRTLLQRVGCDLLIEPIRGQIVLLNSSKVLFRHVIEVGPRYLVPRPDGRLLIGATEEHAGFEKRTTAAAIAGLIDFGRDLVPALGEAQFERCWAGLRPYAPGGLPRIGRVPGTTNLTIAAGHFRAGLQLSPMTAVLVRQLILGQQENEWASDLAIRSTT
ncbi:MAG TPA: glycine oxidase ThiO [Schlesneria sp.]|jgi:glycine oxidase